MPIMTSVRQDKSFAAELSSRFTLVDDETFSDGDYSWVLEWIASQFSPGEIFDADQMSVWAEENGWDKDPAAWADDHGWVEDPEAWALDHGWEKPK